MARKSKPQLEDGPQCGESNAGWQAKQPKSKAPCQALCKRFNIPTRDDQGLCDHTRVFGVIRDHAFSKDEVVSVDLGIHLPLPSF
jgi:hypothetical protein